MEMSLKLNSDLLNLINLNTFKTRFMTTQQKIKELSSSNDQILLAKDNKLKTVNENLKYVQEIVNYDEETENLIRECGEIDGIDPINNIISTIEKESSFDKLFKTISKSSKQ